MRLLFATVIICMLLGTAVAEKLPAVTLAAMCSGTHASPERQACEMYIRGFIESDSLGPSRQTVCLPDDVSVGDIASKFPSYLTSNFWLQGDAAMNALWLFLTRYRCNKNST